MSKHIIVTGGVVSWGWGEAAPGAHLTATMVVTASGLAGGSAVVNEVYGTTADSVVCPARGAAVEVTLPLWRQVLPLVWRQ